MNTTDTTALYPIARPSGADDPRFTLGLAIDVIAVLRQHGYPFIVAGRDLRRLQQALFGFIYQEKSTP